MFFTVINNHGAIPAGSRNRVFLVPDNWDDWFEFETTFGMIVCDENAATHDTGGVKIGQVGLIGRARDGTRVPGHRYPDVPASFATLPENMFSIGQGETYYETLNQLSEGLKARVLNGLRDLAFDLARFEQVQNEPVVQTSLLRSITAASVRGRLHRLSLGDAQLTDYHFAYTLPGQDGDGEPPRLAFDVRPDSQPPTNVHVLIGRNGVGKTRLMRGLAQALLGREVEDGSMGAIEMIQEGFEEWSIAGLVFVSFSAFDDFRLAPSRDDEIPAHHVGLLAAGSERAAPALVTMTPAALANEFTESLLACRSGLRSARWSRAIETLETDNLFAEAEVRNLLDFENDDDEGEWEIAAKDLFGRLSSGHKIVLLTITRLVELVDERTLVLLDEPEAHLHPPLLAAFIRSLSDLLVSRNGVAIVATHSPVVLQEVPASCTWKLRRTGHETNADRPEEETFGANVSVLTREVFGLEIRKAGFHQMIAAVVNEPGMSYEGVLNHFEGQLGDEGRALARALVAERDAREEL